jgi:hypothetical protein
MDGELGQRLKVNADAQVVPGPERIVRALAARNYPTDDSGYDVCGLCEASDHDGQFGPLIHEPDCPWRLAREWVAANPSFTEMGPTTVTHVVVPGVGAAPLADEPEQQS